MPVTTNITLQNEQSNNFGKSYSHQPASTREVAKRLIAPDDVELTESVTLANARLLLVVNESGTTDNTLSVGLATGVYIEEIPPGATGFVWLVGKPTDPTLYFKFANAAGGGIQYVVRD